MSTPARAPTPSRALPPNPLTVDSSALVGRDRLLKKLRRNPYAYFRFVNQAFTNEACRLLASDLEAVPQVNLHGDAHLAQYVVTGKAAGLSDFDDAAFGPAALDLARFGASIFVAAHARGESEAAAQPVFDAFLRAYWQGLDSAPIPTPKVVHRYRARFDEPADARVPRILGYLSNVDEDVRGAVSDALDPFTARMRKMHPELPSKYFDVLDVGSLDMGLGSALAQKFLVRLRAGSDAVADDEFLELKEVGSLEGVACLERTKNPEHVRIMRSQQTLAVRPDRFLGTVRLRGRVFWTHLWSHHYRDFDVLRAEQSDVRDVAISAGVQLGGGHRRCDAAAKWAELRALGPKLQTVAQELARLTVDAWKTFRGVGS